MTKRISAIEAKNGKVTIYTEPAEAIVTSEIANWVPIRNNLSLCQEVRILRGGECPKDVCSEYCDMAVELREMITQARAEGARAERERIKAAVEGLTVFGVEGRTAPDAFVLKKSVLRILDPDPRVLVYDSPDEGVIE